MSQIESPLARLSTEQIDELGADFDAIHDEVYEDLGDRDRRYIVSMIEMHRRLSVMAAGAADRLALLARRGCSARRCNSMAKILENMEIGHNVLHGQWDWMNDPQINSSTWDWDTASTAEAWKHSHNYIHHTFTNIRGKDKDLGYEIMRIDPHQRWHPVYLLQPVYNVLLMALFEWGVAFHDLDLEAMRKGEKSREQLWRSSRASPARRAARSSRTTWRGRWSARPRARRDAWRRRPREPRERVRRLRRRPRAAEVARGARARPGDLPGDADRQRHGEHGAQLLVARDHLLRPLPRPDVHVQPDGGRGRVARRRGTCASSSARPTSRARRSSTWPPATSATRSSTTSSRTCRARATPRSRRRVKAICEGYELPYNGGPLLKQWGMVQRTILRLAFPGGTPRPKPGPYRAPTPTPSRPRRGVIRPPTPTGPKGSGPEQPGHGVRVSVPDRRGSGPRLDESATVAAMRAPSRWICTCRTSTTRTRAGGPVREAGRDRDRGRGVGLQLDHGDGPPAPDPRRRPAHELHVRGQHDARRAGGADVARSASACWSAASCTATRRCWPSSRRRWTSSPAAARSSASAPAGSRRSTTPTGSTSRR